ELYQLLLTFALVLVVSDVVKLVWGSENKTGPSAPGLAGAVRVAGQLVPTYDLALIALGPCVAAGLWWLFYRTRWGVLIRAATLDREMVALLGVDQARLFTGVFALGSLLAGLAGALQLPRGALTPVLDVAIPPLLPTFYVWVLVEILAFALFAASLHLLMGTGGMVSFGHAAAFGLGAYGSALLVRWAKAPMLLALAAAPVAAATAAVIIGFFCVR